MKRSFYYHLIILSGILAAIAFVFQLGIEKALVPIIADIVIIIILMIFTSRVPVKRARYHTISRQKENQVSSQWQKQHDQWWNKYRTKVKNHPLIFTPTQDHLKKKLTQLRRQLILINNQKSRLAIKNSDQSTLVKLDDKIYHIKKRINQIKANIKS